MSLVYFPDDRPGISRRKCGRGYAFYAPDGTHIADKAEVARLKSLGVPPAYDNVWYCPLPNGHLQATGRDARGRKQYRYHADWAKQRAQTKFDQLPQYGEALPSLRRWISDRLAMREDSAEHAIAAVLALLDRASLRVGSPHYSEENGSYGATTLQDRHVQLDDGQIALRYTAKGGKRVSKSLHGKALHRAMERFQDLPGSELITWIDDRGEVRSVRSEQVQEVLAAICGAGITAKTARTWNGSHAAFMCVLGAEDPPTIKAISEAAAERLHNTPAIAQRSYIHPQITAIARGTLDLKAAQMDAPPEDGLRKGEAELLAFLKSQAAS